MRSAITTSPSGQSDDLPTLDAAILTALIDKLDTLLSGFFGADMKPTGSKDPFALRAQRRWVSIRLE